MEDKSIIFFDVDGTLVVCGAKENIPKSAIDASMPHGQRGISVSLYRKERSGNLSVNSGGWI